MGSRSLTQTAIPIITHWYWIFLLCWTLRGGFDILFIIASYSLAQTAVPNQLLGRVSTFIRVLTWSTASIGALLGGIAIEQTHDIAMVYAVVGLLIFVINLLFFLTPLGRAEHYLPKQEVPLESV